MGSLHITFLGTGAPVPTGERVQTGYLIESDDSRVLIDCGSGVLHRLAQAGVELVDIAAVVFTHHHVDHVADLVPLLKARLFLGEPSLTVVGPEGTTELITNLLSAYDYLRDGLNLVVREVTPGSFSVAGFDVAAIETQHVMYCLAYRITPEGDDSPTITLSGDSEASSEVVAFADGSDLLVHDCAYPDELADAPHATPLELGRALDGARIGRTYLTHLAPETDGVDDEMLESIGEYYDGEVRIAHDGLEIEVG
ncbi:MBL fold metallo-hydrolase [Saliphagus sp. GCM10025334]